MKENEKDFYARVGMTNKQFDEWLLHYDKILSGILSIEKIVSSFKDKSEALAAIRVKVYKYSTGHTEEEIFDYTMGLYKKAGLSRKEAEAAFIIYFIMINEFANFEKRNKMPKGYID